MIVDRKPKFFYGYVIVLVAFVIMVVALGTNYSYGVFFEPLLVEFGWTRAMTSGAYSLCLLLYGILVIGSGRLNDRFGPRLLLTGGGFLLGLGYLLMSQVNAIWQLYLFFGVVIGIGLSTSYVPILSTVARWFVKRRGMMTGIVMGGIGAGTMIMPLFLNWLISSYGWRTCYVVIGIISLGVIISIAQFLRRDPQSRGQLPDGGSEVKQESSNLAARGLSFREAIHTRQLWIFWTVMLCLGFTFFSILVHIVIHATGLGIPAATAVNVLSIVGGVSLAGRVAIGMAADRIGNRLVLVVGLIMMSGALFWLLVARELWMLYLFAVIFGFGYGTFVVESPMVAELFGLKSHGALMGLMETGVIIGGTIGPVLTGHIFDISGSYQLAFLINSVVAIVGLTLALLMRPIADERGKTSQK